MQVKPLSNVEAIKTVLNRVFHKVPRATYDPGEYMKFGPVDVFRGLDQSYAMIKNPVDDAINTAKAAIENYAKSQKVYVDMKRKTFKSKDKTQSLVDKLIVVVINPKKKTVVSDSFHISLDKNPSYVNESIKFLNDKKNGKTVRRRVYCKIEETFVRKLYRMVSDLVERSAN